MANLFLRPQPTIEGVRRGRCTQALQFLKILSTHFLLTSCNRVVYTTLSYGCQRAPSSFSCSHHNLLSPLGGKIAFCCLVLFCYPVHSILNLNISSSVFLVQNFGCLCSYIQPSTATDSTSADSTNLRLKIFKIKLCLCWTRIHIFSCCYSLMCIHSIYIVLGIINNLKMI
jgi:hypothetical protein